MYISKFQVLNYKSYQDSSEVEFKPGFNVITGQNSAGKTALLEALTLQFGISRPHRSLLTVPVPGVLPNPRTSVCITLMISGEELLRLMQSVADAQVVFHAPARGFRPTPALQYDGTDVGMNGVLAEVVRRQELSMSIRFTLGPPGESWAGVGQSFLGFYPTEAQRPTDGHQLSYAVRTVGGRLVANGGPAWRSPTEDVRTWVAQHLRQRIYRFRAERFNSGQCSFGANPTLAPDATNLPEVLEMLNANPARFAALNALASEVLPQVRYVSVRPVGNTQVQILVWPHDPKTQREDLAVPLNECGSGVGQVLAILYLVMTSDHPQTIIVDEPQNFLHPGAVRKLIDVLRNYPQHQYIFATHSPTAITAADPSTLTMVRASEGESVLEIMDVGNAKHLQAYLSEIGARLSDVFGADNIVWVEGQTEEQCFPLILRKVANRSLMGTAVVGIRQTGDLQGRDKRRVFEMYRRLSEAKTLLPPAIVFVFDKECLTPNEMEDLIRMGDGLVRFLPRRMYENYLLEPDAVAAVMNGIQGFRERPVSEEEIRELFGLKREERTEGGRQLKYFCRGTEAGPGDWEFSIDGARLLQDSFQELSEARVAYEKMTHSLAITEWLAANRPDTLRPIVDLLAPLLPPQNGAAP